MNFIGSMLARAARARSCVGSVFFFSVLGLAGCEASRHEGRTEEEWVEALHSGDVQLRVRAADALAVMNARSDGARNELVKALEDTSALVRVAVARTLAAHSEGRRQKSYALRVLWKEANDTTSRVRIAALDALALEPYRDSRSIPILVTALRDASPATRATAAVSLAIFGREARNAEAALRAALSDTNEVVRHEARDALAAITGSGARH